MTTPAYPDFYSDFDPQRLAQEVLQGSLEQGLNICVEVCDRWASDPARLALRYQGANRANQDLSFAQLKQDSARLANLLASLGVKKGDRVAALLPRTPELLTVVLATLRLGAVYQPLFTAFGSGAIEYRLSQAQTKVVFSDDSNRSKLDDVANCPPIVRVSHNLHQDIDYYQRLSQQSPDCEPVLIHGDDAMLQMFTSGTVGKSKGVAVPAKALLAFYVYMKYAIDLRAEDKYWNVADPGWAYGLYYAVLGPLLLGQTTHFNEQGFTPETTYQIIRQYGITNLAAAPTAYRLLMANDHILAAGENLGLRVASSAGEPLNPEVINWVKRRLGCPVMDHYGQTETGMTCCNHHALSHPVRIGSMGYSMPGYRVVALDGNFNEIGEGEIGQLAVDMQASPLYFFQGYTWDEKRPYHGRYYLTGDVVISHGDGSYSFTGRDDDIITTAGYRVGPADVESTLLEHPAVAESGVVAKPDATRGSIIKAFVVLKGNASGSDELAKEMQELVRKRLSTHAFPREIEFVDSLPKTPSGKIQRFILRKQAEDEAAQG